MPVEHAVADALQASLLARQLSLKHAQWPSSPMGALTAYHGK
jgi:hypothetical protein